MRDINRIPEILEAIYNAWTINTECRLGQVLNNSILGNQRLVDIEDEELLKGLNDYYDKLNFKTHTKGDV